MNHELRNLFARISTNTERNLIETTILYLRKSKGTGREVEKSELDIKKDEAKCLIDFAINYSILLENYDKSLYIGEGSEQRVYLQPDGKNVIKVNDSIFYVSWEDYFISLLIHNHLFPTTSYQFLGFVQEENTLLAVIKQAFIESTEPTDLLLLRQFLEKKGFNYKKNNDYFHDDLGIILEDLHDENVLTNNGFFFFIDTVIYLK
jgi:Serine/Threonine/Tyrosine Kinase found in polyvalent proteins